MADREHPRVEPLGVACPTYQPRCPLLQRFRPVLTDIRTSLDRTIQARYWPRLLSNSGVGVKLSAQSLSGSGCDSATVLNKPRLLSDSGSSYISHDLVKWLGDQGMDHVRGAPNHPHLVDTIKVRHVSGGWSTLGLKSYQQGRGSFEGTSQHGIWLDEEPPLDVYGECLIRTATTNGIIMITFTPHAGLSEVVMSFLSEMMAPSADP